MQLSRHININIDIVRCWFPQTVWKYLMGDLENVGSIACVIFSTLLFRHWSLLSFMEITTYDSDLLSETYMWHKAKI